MDDDSPDTEDLWLTDPDDGGDAGSGGGDAGDGSGGVGSGLEAGDGGDGPQGPRPDVVLDGAEAGSSVTDVVHEALRDGFSSMLGPVLGEVVARRVGQTVAGVVTTPQYPLGALLVALLFVLVQHRLDLLDPKLAQASLSRRDDELFFPDIFPSTAGATA